MRSSRTHHLLCALILSLVAVRAAGAAPLAKPAAGAAKPAPAKPVAPAAKPAAQAPVPAALTAVAATAKVDPLDWPYWRGPEQNGISREKDLIDRWDYND